MQELSDRLKQISHLPDSQIELILSASSDEDAERLVALPDEQFQTAINAIVARLNSVTQMKPSSSPKLSKSQDSLDRSTIILPPSPLSQSQDSLVKEEPQEAPDLSTLKLKVNREDKPLTGPGAKFRPDGHSEAPEEISITAPKTNPGEVDTSSILHKETDVDHNDTILFKATDLGSTVDQAAQLNQMRETKEITETQIIRDAEDFEKIRQENPSLTMINPNKNDPYLEETFQADIAMHTQSSLPGIKVKRKKSPMPFIIAGGIIVLIIGIYFAVTSIDFSSSNTTEEELSSEDPLEKTKSEGKSSPQELSSPAEGAETNTDLNISTSQQSSPIKRSTPMYQAPFISEGKWALHLVPGFKSKIVFKEGQLEILDQDLTVELWISIVRTQINKTSLLKIFDSDESLSAELYLNKQGQVCFSSIHQETDNFATINYDKKIPANGMHYHLAATRSENKIRLFINGKLRKELEIEYPETTLHSSMIIADRKVDDESFGVFIDELMLSKKAKYKKDFTPSRILNMTEDTVAYAPFERYSLLNFAIYTAQSEYDAEEVPLPDYSWHNFKKINEQVQQELNR